MGENEKESNKPVIEAVDLAKEYGEGKALVQALRGMSFTVEHGEFIVVLGPSGSGKSTLLNILGGMETPTSGKFFFEGRDMAGATPRELTSYRRKEVGFIFQSYNLVPNLTARENIELSVELSDEPMDVDELLDAVDLSKRADHFPAQMSGGEQQRVAIARALAKNPKLLLCDEPTGALDYETGKLILQLLEKVHGEMKKTLMVITHNAPIGEMAEKVLKLRSGEIQETRVNEDRVHSSEIEW